MNSIAAIAAGPQVAARQMLVQVAAGKFVSQPIRMPSIDPRTENAAPALGEHTIEILQELGLTSGDEQG